MFLVDLDGTLIDSDRNHYNAYVRAGLDMSWVDFERAINTEGLDVSEEIREKKNTLMKDEIVHYIPGAEEFIKTLAKHPHCVVTNTSRPVVDLFRKQLPLLNSLNIITREEYDRPKPAPDGYLLALKRYSTGGQVIGFENTVMGYNSIRHVADRVYIVASQDSYCYSVLVGDPVQFISSYDGVAEVLRVPVHVVNVP
jgi:HAD superfamily hydrolase (TIGR01509 family)